MLWLDSGIAEMLAMEMKSCGAYISRSLSFKQAEVCWWIVFYLIFFVCYCAFSALTLLLGRQVEHPAFKKIDWWGVGVIICLERGADCLHMVQLMPLHPKTPSSLASFKSRLVLSFWFRLSQIVLEKRPFNGCSSSSFCCLLSCVTHFTSSMLHENYKQRSGKKREEMVAKLDK